VCLFSLPTEWPRFECEVEKGFIGIYGGDLGKITSGTGADSVGKLLKRVGRCEVQFSYN
jgi:hypothetical protein